MRGESRFGLGHVDHPARDAELVLQRDALLEQLDVLRAVEQEQVADLVQVDLLAELLAERLEGPQAAQAELDVDRVGELRAHPAGRLAGRPGPELVLLDEHHVAARRRRARWYAALSPMTPPPMTTTEAWAGRSGGTSPA